MIAPGERLDLIIDFRESAGSKIVLMDNFVPLMQFRVSSAGVKDDIVLPVSLRTIEKLQESAAVKTRMLSLDEVDDPVQNPVKMLLNGKNWHDPVTENPTLNSTEIWNLINPTDDSHPIHLHLVRFQILDRRKFETFGYLTHQQSEVHGAARASRSHRSWLEGHGSRGAWNGHEDHCAVRRLRRKVRLALPHFGTRGQ